MTEAVNVANNTLLKQQVREKTTGIEEAKCVLSKSLSPTPTSSSKGSAESCLSERVTFMGEEGQEKNEISIEPTEKDTPLPTTNNNNKEEAPGKSCRLSEEERQRNPDSEKNSTHRVVVPSVIRISPKTNGEKATAETAARDSPRVPVIRPKASKTPPQEPNGKSRPGEQAGTEGNAPGNDRNQPPVGERGGKGEKQTPKKEEIKRKDEVQTNFPRRNKPKRMTSGRGGGVPQVDGQAPTQHVQYANTGGGGGARHSNRQDPHGYRQQQARGSITSSAGGTPTMALGRRAPQHARGMSTGSHASDMDEPSPSMPPATPLFQRLVTEEVQELKAYTRIIEEQNRRVNELERRTADLEKRLQKKDKEKADLERTLEYRETEWRNKFDRLESDRDEQKELVEQEKRMNTKLNYQVAQMEQEIHKFLTRKVCTLCSTLDSCLIRVFMLYAAFSFSFAVSSTTR